MKDFSSKKKCISDLWANAKENKTVHQFFLLLPPLFRTFLSHCDLRKGTVDTILRLTMTPPARHLRHLLLIFDQTSNIASVLAGGQCFFWGGQETEGYKAFPWDLSSFFFLSVKWIILRELNWSPSFQNKALKHSSYRALKLTVITGPVSLQTVDIDIQFAMTL